MNAEEQYKRNLIAQWAFDTRPILGRFHLWLEDVDEEFISGTTTGGPLDSISFVKAGMERLFIMTAAVTALGTRLFGRYGDGRSQDKQGLNQVKKEADAISAYAMSESLWYLSRSLPENHAVVVSLGEGLMPKGGETPEMGSNPLLGFGRVYARPQVARFIRERIHRLINSPSYGWKDFYREVNEAHYTIWGAAVDTLENTTRFTKGADSGPLTVLHIFDQPLCFSQPYEGYMGNLIIPQAVVDRAAQDSLLIDFFTPRDKVLDAIRRTYLDIKPQNIHVWTLQGKSRVKRLAKLWQTWQKLGVHVIEAGWPLPGGGQAFTESGTYAPCYRVGDWYDKQGQHHLLIEDGYAASAEAVQAASLAPILGLKVSLAIFSAKFELSYEREAQLMKLDPGRDDFADRLEELFDESLDKEKIDYYRHNITQAKAAGLPLQARTVTIRDFLPEKQWHILALSGYMLPDPYSGAEGVRKLADNIYEVTVRLATKQGQKQVKLALRLMETFRESQRVFNPLLDRFMQGEDYTKRPVKISDSGRIRNELQTLCSEALEYVNTDQIRVHFNKIPPEVIRLENQAQLKQILLWYQQNHPIWFKWLEIVD